MGYPGVSGIHVAGRACALRDPADSTDAVSAGQCCDNPPAPLWGAGGKPNDVHCRPGEDRGTRTTTKLTSSGYVPPAGRGRTHTRLRGRPDATEDDVLRACEFANCLDVVHSLPEGLQTIVGERGSRLSGGQRQRIAIARAFLKNAPILLLDEATSALDSESEALVQVGLDALMKGRTVVAIAHRLSTLQNFDRIVVIQHGRLVDEGTPLELAGRPGIYRDLLLSGERQPDASADRGR